MPTLLDWLCEALWTLVITVCNEQTEQDSCMRHRVTPFLPLCFVFAFILCYTVAVVTADLLTPGVCLWKWSGADITLHRCYVQVPDWTEESYRDNHTGVSVNVDLLIFLDFFFRKIQLFLDFLDIAVTQNVWIYFVTLNFWHTSSVIVPQGCFSNTLALPIEVYVGGYWHWQEYQWCY